MDGTLGFFGLAHAEIKGVELNVFFAQKRLDFVGHDAGFMVKRNADNTMAITTKLGLMLLQQFIKCSHQCLGFFGPAQNDNIYKSRQHIFGNQKARLKGGECLKMPGL